MADPMGCLLKKIKRELNFTRPIVECWGQPQGFACLFVMFEFREMP